LELLQKNSAILKFRPMVFQKFVIFKIRKKKDWGTKMSVWLPLSNDIHKVPGIFNQSADINKRRNLDLEKVEKLNFS